MSESHPRVAIICAIIALISAVVVAVIGYRTNMQVASLEAQTRNMALRMQGDEVALKKSIFEAEQASREERTLSECVSKLTSEKLAEKRQAVALLFALYPNDAPKYLDRISEAISFSDFNFMTEAISSAKELEMRTGDWAIRIENEFSTLDEAERAAGTLEQQIGINMSIYKVDEFYRLVLGKYSSREQATSALITIEPKLHYISLERIDYSFLWMQFGHDITLIDHAFRGTVINLKDTFGNAMFYGNYFVSEK